MFNTINEALTDLKQGKVVIVCDDENRENEGDFVGLAEFVTPDMINLMITHGRGLVCMPITKKYAEDLELNDMVLRNTDNHQTAFTVSIDHVSNSTGISTFDRATTIQKTISDGVKASDFRRPGHIFPLVAKANGVFERLGHTEAVVDLARLCKSKPAGVICEIVNFDGTMARYPELVKIAKQLDLKMITIADLVKYRKIHDKLVAREVEVLLPTKFGEFTMFGYQDLVSNKEHVAIVKGSPSLQQVPLVRIHSECLTGDVFHSKRCDCGEQLEHALTTIENEGSGIVIYLRQEGRGIGLLNKLRAYKLQQNGYDTIDANRKLGFADDLREYYIAAQILKDLGVNSVRLITNNPSKIAELEEYGVKVVERVSKASTVYPENKDYLATKISRLGHLL